MTAPERGWRIAAFQRAGARPGSGVDTPGRGASGWAVVKWRLLARRMECALSCDSILRALWAGDGISKMEPLATGQPRRGWDCWEILSRHPLPGPLMAVLMAPSPAQPQAPCPLLEARPIGLDGRRSDAVEWESEGCCWWWRGLGRHSCPPDVVTHWLWRGWMDLWGSGCPGLEDLTGSPGILARRPGDLDSRLGGVGAGGLQALLKTIGAGGGAHSPRGCRGRVLIPSQGVRLGTAGRP